VLRAHRRQSVSKGQNRGCCAHTGAKVFRREGELGALCAFRQRSVSEGESWGAVCTNGGRSADCAREAVRGLPGAVADYTAVDASSVHARLLRSIPTFLRRPQVPPLPTRTPIFPPSIFEGMNALLSE